MNPIYDEVLNQWLFSDINIDKSDYIKLREVILSYNVPNIILKKAGLKNFSINIQARNLWYWAANKDKYDPEFISATNGIYSIPLPVTYAIGFRAGF